jgi:hypothetical protein
MAWFRLEGRGAFHHKVLAAGNEAYGAWCRAGQWSSDQLTDGFVPRAVAEQIAKPKVWAKLIAARLVDDVDAGYQIHDLGLAEVARIGRAMDALVAQQGFAGTGELDAAGATDEQWCAECAFQLLQPVAGRRRREVRAFGAARQVRGLGNGDEEAEIGEVVTHRSYYTNSLLRYEQLSTAGAAFIIASGPC